MKPHHLAICLLVGCNATTVDLTSIDSPRQHPDYEWVKVRQSELTPQGERNIEQWLYDEENRLVLADEINFSRAGQYRALTEHSYSNAEVVTTIDWQVDGEANIILRRTLNQGRVTSVEQISRANQSDNRSLQNFGYDTAGRLIAIQEGHQGRGSGQSVERDEEGRIVAQYLSGEPWRTWSYDEHGRVIAEHHERGLDNYEFKYNDAGQVIEKRYFRPQNFSGWTRYKYDEAGRFLSSESGTDERPDDVLVRISYTYDLDGRRASRTHVDYRSNIEAVERSFYDELGRLIRHENWQNGELSYERTLDYQVVTKDGDEVEVISRYDEDVATRTTYKRLTKAPITPPETPRLSVELPFPSPTETPFDPLPRP